MANTDKQAGGDLENVRHSASHVMAQAVMQMFPDAKLGIGPAIENGFYYDFDLPRPLTPDDLPEISERMQDIIKNNYSFTREEVSKDEARRILAHQPYKLELIDDLDNATISLYRQGDFVDLCRGPHVESTGQIKAYKLTSIAGAYWRGDEKRPMLQRIYGAVFATRAELDEYIFRMEEAAKRDHRKLGKELDLFSIHEEAGAGLVCWHPKGAAVRRIIEDFWRSEHVKRNYDIVYTPHIAKVDLWKISGHWDYYRENMYSPMEIDDDEYVLKPMNCLYHILIYNNTRHSYRELPIRMAELGTVYRYERSGVLHGLSRVRGFTQDDAHIFCRPDQLEAEVMDVLDLAMYMIDTFGFTDFKVMLSTRPEKYAGTDESWEMATSVLEDALKKNAIKYYIDPGEGVFYGPKIDIKFLDTIGRAWQGPTIQVDFNNPQRFDVSYIGEDGQAHQVVMVHRVVLGSMERFMASLIEHYGGAFPLWLAPIQVCVIPIADRHQEYAYQLAAKLKPRGIRVEVAGQADTMNHKIRQAQLNRIPCMLIIGDKEMAGDCVSVRLRNGQQSNNMPFADLAEILEKAVVDRSKDFTI